MGAKMGVPQVDKTSTLLPNYVATKVTISSMEVGRALCSPGKARISHKSIALAMMVAMMVPILVFLLILKVARSVGKLGCC